MHFDFNKQSQYGAQLHSHLQGLKTGKRGLKDILSTMTHMLTGDGSQEAHYADIKEKFGFVSNAEAKDAMAELNSANAKIKDDTQQTNVHAALEQCFDKFA